MDTGTVLAIVGIVLTALCFLITTNKINNSRINNSFNKTTKKIHRDNRTIVNHHHHEKNEHHHHTNVVKQENTEDNAGIMIGIFIGVAFVAGISLYFFVRYHSQFNVILSSMAILGLVFSCLVVFFLRDYLSAWQRFVLIMQWILVFVVLIFSQHPFATPSNLDEVMDSFRNIKLLEAPGTFIGLVSNGKDDGAYFLFFKLIGLLMCLVAVLLNYYFLIKLCFKKYVDGRQVNQQLIGDVILLGLSFIMVSGLFTKFVN